jgi:uncharacterized protein (TIGR02001 family)
MKTYLTLSAIALAAAASLSSGVASAEEPAAAPVPDIAVTSNVGITSDYRFRGISQNDKDPSYQGGFDVAFNKLGLYVGTWGSNVSKFASPHGSLELDLYGGYKTEVAGVAIDIGAIMYQYPGSVSTDTVNTREAYIGLGYGPAVFKTSYVLNKNYFGTTTTGNAKGTLYYDLTLSQELMPKLTGSVHAGYTDFKESASAYGNLSYSDYNLGLSYDLDGFALGAKYYVNSTKAGTKTWAADGGTALYKNGFALSLTRSF